MDKFLSIVDQQFLSVSHITCRKWAFVPTSTLVKCLLHVQVYTCRSYQSQFTFS